MTGSAKRALYMSQTYDFHYGSKCASGHLWGKVRLLQHSYLGSLPHLISKRVYNFFALDGVMIDITLSIHHITIQFMEAFL